jgi:thiol:disulfide interchange protein
MPKQHHRKPSHLPQFLAIGGVALLVLAVFAFKEKPQAAVPTANPIEPAEAQLDRALADHRPTLAFFHSNNCKQCLIMIETVSQVYPDFSSSIALVDVNVYDENNAVLLKRVGLQFIPTLIFYDHDGNEQVSIGLMEAEQLHQTLVTLVEGD